jgi:WD40 repeat protein
MPVHKPLKGGVGPVTSAVYSPDGRQIASVLWSMICIWDTETGTLVGNPLPVSATCATYSNDSKSIIAGDRKIQVWDVQTQAQVGQSLEGHDWNIKAVECSPDGRNITSASDDTTMRIWDIETMAPVGEPLGSDIRSVPNCITYSPDGRYIASGYVDRNIRIWDVESRVMAGPPLEGHTSQLEAVAYSPDGRHIVSGSWDETIRIWDIGSATQVGQPLTGHTGFVNSVAYSPDGRRIVSGSNDTAIRVWDAQTGLPVLSDPRFTRESHLASGKVNLSIPQVASGLINGNKDPEGEPSYGKIGNIAHIRVE